MPKVPKSLQPTTVTRRSSRLQKAVTTEVVVEIEDRPKAKRRRITSNTSGASANCLESISLERVADPPRRSERITSTELLKREAALLRREQEYEQKNQLLLEQLASLAQKETQASLVISRVAEREAKATLAQMEEHFSCSLCYEIMAYPFTLSPSGCGHTFCAICILKWFFSRLHKACGGWHEPVDCPICRSRLPINPDMNAATLRVSFPFVPSRTVSDILTEMTGKLAAFRPSDSGLVVKKEEGDSMTWVSQSSGCNRNILGLGKDKEHEGDEDDISDVVGWREGGLLRAEWLKKDSDGRKEMSYFMAKWATMKPGDFIAMKTRLGV